MCISKRASEQIQNTLTCCDLVKTVSYSLFPRTSLNLSKLGVINKALIFGSGLSGEYDCRSVREWEDQAHRFICRGAYPTYIVVPILVNIEKNGKVIQELKGYKDANLFSASQVYGDPITYEPELVRFVDLKATSERFGLELGDLPEKLPVVSYFNESDHDFEVASHDLKKFIYNVVLRSIKMSSYKKQPAKDRIVLELLTLSILRSLGRTVNCDKEYHSEISKFGLYQKLSTTASYFSILKGIEIVFDTMDLNVIE